MEYTAYNAIWLVADRDGNFVKVVLWGLQDENYPDVDELWLQEERNTVRIHKQMHWLASKKSKEHQRSVDKKSEIVKFSRE